MGRLVFLVRCEAPTLGCKVTGIKLGQTAPVGPSEVICHRVVKAVRRVWLRFIGDDDVSDDTRPAGPGSSSCLVSRPGQH